MKPLLLGDEFKFTKRDHLSSDNHLVPLPLRTDLLISLSLSFLPHLLLVNLFQPARMNIVTRSLKDLLAQPTDAFSMDS
jgi:hypothetical protein